MSVADQKVLEETKRFHQALPDLLPKLRGRWIVFLDGAVQSEHKTEDQAYTAAVARFGAEGGFVVARVEEVTPTPITAGVLFGQV